MAETFDTRPSRTTGEAAGRRNAPAPWPVRRYRDVDGDGIPYRTVPATACRVLRPRLGHNELRSNSSVRTIRNNLDSMARKFETARPLMPKPVVDEADGARIGLIGYGTTHWAIVESRDS